MKALSIQQPWASLIISGSKDVENRTWPTKYRGPLLIHASKKLDREALGLMDLTPEMLLNCTSLTGGIIGMVHLVACVDNHPSKWFVGPYGFVLRNPRSLPFYRANGRLGLFDLVVPEIAEQKVQACDV